jgi:cyclopropane-fatty-acyl-phospholipid synthase
MFGEKRFEKWVDDIRSRVEIPLRLELWNGQTFSFSKEQASVVAYFPNVSALRYLLTPSLSNLGYAYVEGIIDVKGKAADIIALANVLATHTIKARGRFSRLVRTFTHNRQRDAEAISFHYDVSNDFYAQWLDENMVYSCAYFKNGDEYLASA